MRSVRGLATSCGRAAARVSALDFRMSTEAAVRRARLVAIEELLPSIVGRWQSLALLLAQTATSGLFDRLEARLMRFERAQAVYVPMWSIDAVWTLACSGQRAARASFATHGSAMPGNAWSALRTLPLRPPPHRPGAESDALVTGAADPAEYAPYDPARHLHPEADVGAISVVPFDLSPLGVPELIRRASPADLAVRLEAEANTKRFSILPGVQVEVRTESMSDSGTHTLRFAGDSLDIDMFACFPVLVPVHLVSFRYDAHGERDLRATVAIGAWDERLLAFSLKRTPDAPWRRRGHAPWLLLRMLDLDPLPLPHAELADIDRVAREVSRSVQRLADRADWAACAHAPDAWDSPHVRSLAADGPAADAYASASVGALYTQLMTRMMESEARENGHDALRIELDGRILSGADAFAHVHVMRAEAQQQRAAARPAWLPRG